MTTILGQNPRQGCVTTLHQSSEAQVALVIQVPKTHAHQVSTNNVKFD